MNKGQLREDMFTTYEEVQRQARELLKAVFEDREITDRLDSMHARIRSANLTRATIFEIQMDHRRLKEMAEELTAIIAKRWEYVNERINAPLYEKGALVSALVRGEWWDATYEYEDKNFYYVRLKHFPSEVTAAQDVQLIPRDKPANK